MKSIILLITLLYITIDNVSCQVGDQRTQLFFEYLRPYWRIHRARLRPFVFAQPAPLWRVARGIESDPKSANCMQILDKLFCYNGVKELECTVEKSLPSLFEGVYVYGMSAKSTGENGVTRFSLLPKLEPNSTLNAADLKVETQNKLISIHSTDLKDTDNGFTVTDDDCWLKMIDLLTTTEFQKEVNVEKSNLRNEIRVEKATILGNMLVF